MSASLQGACPVLRQLPVTEGTEADNEIHSLLAISADLLNSQILRAGWAEEGKKETKRLNQEAVYSDSFGEGSHEFV